MNICIDVETKYGDHNKPWCPDSYLSTVHVAFEDGSTFTYPIDVSYMTVDDKLDLLYHVADIQRIINEADRIIGHNLKFDLHWLMYLGLDFSETKLFCTQVAEYIVTGQSTVGQLSLDDLCLKYGLPKKHDTVKEYWQDGVETRDIPYSILKEYGEHDAAITLQLFPILSEQIKEHGQERLVAMEMETLRSLQLIEWNGMLIDTDLCTTSSAEYGDMISAIDAELFEIFGREININSGQQLSAVMYGGVIVEDGIEEVKDDSGNSLRFKGGARAGQIKTRKCKLEIHIDGIGFQPVEGSELAKDGYYQTDLGTFKQLRCKNNVHRRVLSLLEERSSKNKMKTTYFDGMLNKQVDGYVHPNLNQTIAVTSRLTSSDPNGQNIPRAKGGPKNVFITRY